MTEIVEIRTGGAVVVKTPADAEVIEARTGDSTVLLQVSEFSIEVGKTGPQGPAGAAGAAGPAGPPGPAGPAGPNEIGGYPVQFTAAASGDLLAIGANKIINIQAPTLTDGGNF